jgi:hypothetical protein
MYATQDNIQDVATELASKLQPMYEANQWAWGNITDGKIPMIFEIKEMILRHYDTVYNNARKKPTKWTYASSGRIYVHYNPFFKQIEISLNLATIGDVLK